MNKVKVVKNSYSENGVLVKSEILLKNLKIGQKVPLITGKGFIIEGKSYGKRGIFIDAATVTEYGIPQPVKNGEEVFIDLEIWSQNDE